MAKDEIVRTAIGAAESVAVSVKQSEVNALLKKKAVEVAEKDKAHDQSADADQAAAAPAEASASVEVADASDALGFASDAGISPSVLLSGASAAGETGGISNTTLLVGGGVLLAGGAIAIASNSGGGGHKDPVPVVTAVSAADSVNEGQVLVYTLTGTPGAVFAFTLGGTAVQGTDYTISPASSVTFDAAGNAVVTVTVINDAITEGAETIVLTSGGVSDTATINDTSLTPVIPPQIYVLTTLTDPIVITGIAADHIAGVAAGGNPSFETFSVGDNVQGNGLTILDLKIVDGGSEAVVQLDKIAAINIDNLDGNTNATFNASLWTDIGEINLVDGQDGLDAYFSDLERGVDFSIASGVSGSLSASFTDHLYAYLYAGHDSDISWVANNVDANVTKGEAASFSLLYDDINPLDITLGTVTAAVADSATFSLTVTDSGGDGTVTVGDVHITTGKDSNADVDITADDSQGFDASHTFVIGDVALIGSGSDVGSVTITVSEDLAGNVSVGDVTITNYDDVNLYVARYNATADAGAGDVTVANVSLAVNKSGSLSGTIGNSGTGVIGDVHVGNVTVALAQLATASYDIYNYVTATGSDDAVAGNVTVGNIDLELATSASFDTLNIYNYASATGSGDATIGNLSIGDIRVNAAVDASATINITATATVGVAGVGTVGDVTVGDIDVSLNDNASVSINVTVNASGGGIGDVTIGDIKFDSANGVDADGSFELDVNDSGDIGQIKLGDILVINGDDAEISIDVSVTGASVAGVTVGDVTFDLLFNASSPDFGFDVSATDGDIGNILFGDVMITSLTGGDFSGTVSLTASENIGNITFGDIFLSAIGDPAVDTATVEFSIDASAGLDVGNITIGDLTVSAGSSADAHFTLSASGASDVGTVRLGNVALSAIGTASEASLSIVTSTISGGDIIAGDIDLTVQVGEDNPNSATLSITVVSAGDITVGDINILLDIDDTTVAGVGTDNLNVAVTAAGDITTGIISVAGGDTSHDNLDVFTNITGAFSYGGDFTIGGVDYSGYLADATIDVSGVKGAGIIIGSDFDDVITDNTGTNVITGGDGLDLFIFDAANTGLAPATVDQITDWVKADDQIDVGFTPVAGTNYAELGGTFASLSAFITAANGVADGPGTNNVVIGLSGGSLYVAVDSDGVEGIDYAIQLVGINSINSIDVADFV